MNRGIAALLAALVASALCTAGPGATTGQEQGLPPGPGWAVAGPAAPVLDHAPPSVSPLAAGAGGIWLGLSRPFGVVGLNHACGEVWARTAGVTLSAALAHLEGDGIAVGVLSLQVLDTLAGVSAEPRVWRRDGRRLVASLGWAVHRLRWGDGTGSTASHMSAGAGIEYGAFRIWLSAETPLGGWLRTRVGWALGWRSPMFQAALGWRMEQGRRAVPASAVRASVGIFLLTAGLWGAPPAPSLGVLLPAGGWGVGAEIRHVPGPGTCVLWSFAFPCGIRP